MSKKISLGVAATIAIIAMAVTFSLTMVVSMKMFNTTVSSVKNKERQYNKLSEIDRFVRSEEFFTIDEDTLNDRLAAGYMNGINDKYAVYYTAKEYSEKQAVEKGTLTGIGVAVVNDASSARPDGSMEVVKLFWWEHNCKDGQYSTAKVHRSVKAVLREGVDTPTCAGDYIITAEYLEGLEPEVLEGL